MRGSTLAALTFIYPFLWMASSTFKPPLEVGTLALIPDQITLDNYRTMWARAPFGRALLNSTLVATTITARGSRVRLDDRLRDGAPAISAGVRRSTPRRWRCCSFPAS